MDRRTFLTLAAPLAAAANASGEVNPELPKYRVVSRYPAGSGKEGMPGRYPGAVVRVRGEHSIDTATNVIHAPAVKEMIAQGMRGLTGASDDREAWRSFFSRVGLTCSKDVVPCSSTLMMW